MIDAPYGVLCLFQSIDGFAWTSGTLKKLKIEAMASPVGPRPKPKEAKAPSSINWQAEK